MRSILALACCLLLGPVPSARAGEILSLGEALRAADQHNLTLKALQTTLDQADGQLRQARGLLVPMVSAGGTWSHADHEDTVDLGASMSALYDMLEAMGIEVPDAPDSEPMVVRQQETVSGSLTASLSVLDPETWATARVAREGRDLARLTVAQARQELLHAVARAWYAARATGALVAMQEERVDAAMRHLDVAEKRLATGVGLRIDEVRARTDLAQARQDLLSARLAFESARDALGVLTGVGGLPTPGDAPVIAPPPLAPEQMVDVALDRREDVRVARSRAHLARADLALARTGFLPGLSLAWQGSYTFTEMSALGSDDRSRWTAVASLDVPVFSLSRFGALDQKRAAMRRAEIEREHVEIQAGQAVRQAVRDQQTALAAVSLAVERAELAREAVALTETAYAQGAGSSLEVSDAEANRLAAEVNRLTSELQAQVDTLHLLRALGSDILSLVR
ncbi:MAG: TolC family protein [Deltaproteobacteria bacterium]|nr:TolC family protein [Deltaproteobacteria bacterium]